MKTDELKESISQLKVDLKVDESKIATILKELKEYKISSKNAEKKLSEMDDKISSLKTRKQKLLTKAEEILDGIEDDS